MFASTNVLTASPLLSAVPSVSTWRFPISVADACPVTLPAVLEAKGDRALAARVRVRTPVRAAAARRAMSCPVRLGQREVDVLAGSSHIARAGVLRQRHREGV